MAPPTQRAAEPGHSGRQGVIASEYDVEATRIQFLHLHLAMGSCAVALQSRTITSREGAPIRTMIESRIPKDM